MILHQRLLRTIYDILSLTNYSLNCWCYSLVYTNSCYQLMIFFSFPIEKEYNFPVLTVPPMSHLTSCVPTKSNLYLANSLGTVPKWPWPTQAPNIPCTKSHVAFPLPRSYQRLSPGLSYMYYFRNQASFYSDELLSPRPTPKLEDNPFSAVRYCLFNVFAATLHIGGRSSKRNLRTHHAVVTQGIRFHWSRNLRFGSAAPRFLGSWVWIPSAARMSVYCVVRRQVEVSATGRSLVQRSPIECDVCDWQWSRNLYSEEASAH